MDGISPMGKSDAISLTVLLSKLTYVVASDTAKSVNLFNIFKSMSVSVIATTAAGDLS